MEVDWPDFRESAKFVIWQEEHLACALQYLLLVIVCTFPEASTTHGLSWNPDVPLLMIIIPL